MTQNSKDLSMLETERLLLSYPSKDAIPDIIKNLNDLDVSKWLAVVPYPYTEVHADWYINYAREKRLARPRDAYEYWVKLKSTEETIGGVGLSKINQEKKSGTIGYWLGSAHHRRGYGSEFLGKILDVAFKELYLESIDASVMYGNPSSGKLLEKFGAKSLGEVFKTHFCKATGLEQNIFEYTLTKKDYEESRGRNE